VGFSANQRPGFLREDDSAPAWARTRECTGPEQRYAGGTDRWPALRFFFGEVVRAQSPPAGP
jgi:hypothetical protein